MCSLSPKIRNFRGPPRPHIPALWTKAGAKVLLFFELTKFFGKKMQKKCIFLEYVDFFAYLCTLN